MPDIVASKKVPEGIVVMWGDGSSIKSENFNYQDLIDQNVNALDLLDRPIAYKIDPKLRKISPKY